MTVGSPDWMHAQSLLTDSTGRQVVVGTALAGNPHLIVTEATEVRARMPRTQ